MVSCKRKSAKHFTYQTMLMSAYGTDQNVTFSVVPSITTLTVCRICLHFLRINLMLILINEHKKLWSYFRERLLRGRCHPKFGQQKTWEHQRLFWLTPRLVRSVQQRTSISHWYVPSRTVRNKKAWAIPRYTSDAQYKKKKLRELLGFLPVHSHLSRKIRAWPVETSVRHFNKFSSKKPGAR